LFESKIVKARIQQLEETIEKLKKEKP
jgi:hypothetical protein